MFYKLPAKECLDEDPGSPHEQQIQLHILWGQDGIWQNLKGRLSRILEFCTSRLCYEPHYYHYHYDHVQWSLSPYHYHLYLSEPDPIYKTDRTSRADVDWTQDLSPSWVFWNKQLSFIHHSDSKHSWNHQSEIEIEWCYQCRLEDKNGN